MPEDIYWRNYESRFRTFPRLIQESMYPEVKTIICIPVIAEAGLIKTLSSVLACHSNSLTEVIIFFNTNVFMSRLEKELHDKLWHECNEWIVENNSTTVRFLPVYANEMPDAAGGVGWARKLAMDEAARRLSPDGIIVCLDGDCTVSNNYLDEIQRQFLMHPDDEAASISFEHPLDQVSGHEREAIMQYELHLRYLVQAQRWCGHPFAFHTVGSAMAVRRNAYLSQGGMNTRRAGEDFYFLQKFIETGKLFEIKNATVYPSSRISFRVPFGTGRAMAQVLNERRNWLTTNFETFKKIKPLFQLIEELPEGGERHISIPEANEISDFLHQINFYEKVADIARHTNSKASFKKRFFRFFNAFQMIRYMHYMRDHHYEDLPVEEAIRQFRAETGLQTNPQMNLTDLLEWMRNLDRRGN